jgi:hypothetical protein
MILLMPAVDAGLPPALQKIATATQFFKRI